MRGTSFYRRAVRIHRVNLIPVTDSPALVMGGSRKWVCIADLHIGIESVLRASGFNIPSQLPKMSSAIESLASHGDRLLILGDVKHRITHATHREDREVRSVMNKAMEAFQAVVVTPGNHDGGLKEMMPDGCLVTANSGSVVGGVGVFHGHVWPSDAVMASDEIVMGHIHPSMALEGSMGGRTNEKCWIRARLSRKNVRERYSTCPKELIVAPAFNPLISGTPMNRPGGGRLGPMLRNRLVNELTMKAYLLDGTDLGRPSPR